MALLRRAVPRALPLLVAIACKGDASDPAAAPAVTPRLRICPAADDTTAGRVGLGAADAPVARIDVPAHYDWYPFDLDGTGETAIVGWPRAAGDLLVLRCEDGAWATASYDFGGGALENFAQVGEPVAADLDGDGDADLVGPVYGISAPSVHARVLWNEGGTFTAVDLPDADGRALDVGDLDGDGAPDILAGLDVYAQSQGSFVLTSRVDARSDADLAVAIADLDGDGRRDILATYWEGLDGETIQVAWNGADGWSSGLWYTDEGTGRPRAGDADGDGDTDLVLPDLQLLFTGRAAGTRTGDGIDGPVIDVDLDGDGDHVGVLGGAVAVAPEDGSGLVDVADGRYPAGGAARFADFTGDGLPDLLVQEPTDEGILSIYANVGEGRFAVPTRGGKGPEDAALADLDGDGRLDLLTTAAKSQSAVAWYRGEGDGLAPVTWLGSDDDWPHDGSPYEGVEACDLDTDGDPDLAVLVQDGRVVLGWNEGGEIASWETIPILAAHDENAGFEALLCADLDGDGAPDLAAASRSRAGSDVWVAPNEGGTFPFSAMELDVPVAGLVAADLDGDGIGELIMPDEDGARVLVAWGTGERTELATGKGPEAVAAADLDDDGDVDLVVGDSDDGTISVHTNDGHGAFTRVVVASGMQAEAVAVLDADGLPPLDVAVVVGDDADDGNSLLDLVLREDASVEVRAWPSGGTDPRALVATDVDEDGLDDLLVLDKASDAVAEFRTTVLAP